MSKKIDVAIWLRRAQKNVSIRVYLLRVYLFGPCLSFRVYPCLSFHFSCLSVSIFSCLFVSIRVYLSCPCLSFCSASFEIHWSEMARERLDMDAKRPTIKIDERLVHQSVHCVLSCLPRDWTRPGTMPCVVLYCAALY